MTTHSKPGCPSSLGTGVGPPETAEMVAVVGCMLMMVLGVLFGFVEFGMVVLEKPL